MNAEAFRLIQECFITKDTYLDLGSLGLTDYDFTEESQLDKLLRQCTHLQILVLSNGWWHWDADGKSTEQKSRNNGKKNKLNALPPALVALTGLVTLIIGGHQEDKWGITEMDFVAGLTALQQLYLGSTLISEISSLDDLSALQQLYLGSNQISEISGLEGLSSLQQLSLFSNQISEIRGLESLSSLQELSISFNQISGISGLEGLSSLQQLNLFNNKISEISGLDGLSSLQRLNLGDNKISEIGVLAGLSALRQLKLYNNKISEIGDLAGLSALQQLDISSNQITEIEVFNALTALQTLGISGNGITEIKGLNSLTSLQTLNISVNQITEIKGLNSLTSLQTLDISVNKITEIKGLDSLTGLQTLNLSGNQITRIKGLDSLTSLQTLSLYNNQITEIKGLDSLTGLQALYLNGNKITEINGLGFIKEKDFFALQIHNNPLVQKYQLKLERGENHFPYIKDWWLRQAEVGKKPVKYPIKILLLGNHKAGKSSLVDMLTGLKSTGSTHILRIANYTMDKAKAAPGQLPDAVFYDFGGQDFYHGLYLAFISSGGLQLVLYNSAKDWNGHDKDGNDYDIVNFNRHYWLGQKNHTANTDPYIMVQTYAEADGATEASPIDYTCYTGFKKSFFLSLNNNPGPEHKEEEAFYAAGKKYFKTYFNGELKKMLRQQQHEEPQWYIDFLAYIFNKNNFSHTASSIDEVLKQYKDEQPGNERKETLKRSLTLLHRHGLVLYYDTDGLQNSVWLNPEALVQHIQQKVLTKDLLRNTKGVVPRAAFESNILNDKKIRTLLLKQKVIFLHQPTQDEADGEYIIPNYLPLASDTDPDYQLFVFGLQQPDFTIKFNDFIPFGFINQMICFYGKQPDAKRFWRNQLLFTLHKEARVVIQLDFETLQIKVHLQLLPHATTKAETIKSYLFFTLMLLLWDKWSGGVVQLDDFIAVRFPANEKEEGTAEREQEALEGVYTHLPAVFVVKEGGGSLQGHEVFPPIGVKAFKKEENESEIREVVVQVLIPIDTYISVDGWRYVAYKDLFALNGQTMLPAYLLGSNGRIDPTTGKEIPVNPLAPFTNNKITAMKKIFISYSKFDEEYKEEFRKHLVTLKEQKLISSFNCKEIDLGADWDETIQREIDECDIMICLVSVDFLNTEYIRKYEVEKAMDKSKQLIPIIIKPCDWENSSIGKLYAPLRGKSISLDQELSLRNIVKETSAIERAGWWTAIIKEMREKLFK